MNNYKRKNKIKWITVAIWDKVIEDSLEKIQRLFNSKNNNKIKLFNKIIQM